MKRPPIDSQTDVRSARERTLTQEERAIWESVARQVKPLPKHRAAKSRLTSPPENSKGKSVPPKLPASSQKMQPAKAEIPAVPPLVPLARRERAGLSRGRKQIDARLDLHGMTQARAHRALTLFLQRAHSDGLGFVLVITGKGNADAANSERGVLRRQVPQWLSLPEFRPLVIGFEEAHVGHGGAGALYVRIRRNKSRV
jgi:DNA-nicking Smr family endonuclease